MIMILTKHYQPLNSLWDLLDDPFWHKPQTKMQLTVPLDIQHGSEQVVIEAELPGVDKKNISITYLNGELTLEGSKMIDQVQQDHDQLYNERVSGSFKRRIKVGDIDFKTSKADFKNGLLTITLPKLEAEKSKTISIG